MKLDRIKNLVIILLFLSTAILLYQNLGETNGKTSKQQTGIVIPENFDDMVIGKLKDGPIKVSDLSASSRKHMWLSFKQFYRMLKVASNHRSEDVYFLEKAGGDEQKARSLREEAFRVKPIDDETAKKYYDERKDSIPYPYEDIKGELIKYLEKSAREKNKKSIAETAKQATGYEFHLPQILPSQFDIDTRDYAYKGTSNAAIEIVEFADFRCGHCRAASKHTKDLLKEFEGKIKIVYRYYTRKNTRLSEETAIAAECALQQDKFWPYHDLLFGPKHTGLNATDLTAFAQEVGLDRKQWDSCRIDPKTKKRINQSTEEGKEIGVISTPTFFVNGRVVRTGHDLAELTDYLRQL